MQDRSKLFISIISCAVILALPAQADPGDTTTVITFDHQNHNNGNHGRSHTDTFEFPDGSVLYDQVYVTYEMSCPTAGCDPWDRLGRLFVLRATSDTTSEEIEIARIITPYDISSGPGTCTWGFDMTDYLSILRGEVTLRTWIDTWVGGNQGWECTVIFHFIEGELSHTPYRIENLWNIGYLIYGDPDNPPASHLGFSIVPTDEFTDFMTLRIWTTGHGQGNTHNAAEFSRKDHGVWIGIENFEHELWRDNCEHNDCSPQGGTWQFDRAGWCPGDRVFPWDMSAFSFTPGSDVEVLYYLEPYENLCRPNNPDCIPGSTCADCNYNWNGHTEPYYVTSGQLIFWREGTSSAPPEHQPLPDALTLEQNYPNPFNSKTTIRFSIPSRTHVELTVYNITGSEVMTLIDGTASAGNHVVHFDGSRLSSGVYFYSLRTADATLTKKMLYLK